MSTIRFIKLTGITGQPVYLTRLYDINFLVSVKDGELAYTEIPLNGYNVKVKETPEEIIALLEAKAL
jgi:hypothetical protein